MLSWIQFLFSNEIRNIKFSGQIFLKLPTLSDWKRNVFWIWKVDFQSNSEWWGGAVSCMWAIILSLGAATRNVYFGENKVCNLDSLWLTVSLIFGYIYLTIHCKNFWVSGWNGTQNVSQTFYTIFRSVGQTRRTRTDCPRSSGGSNKIFCFLFCSVLLRLFGEKTLQSRAISRAWRGTGK